MAKGFILVSIDALRPDFLGCYGATEARTPCIDGLARDGILFERAFSVANWTLPSHVSMFTSLPPQVHGCVKWDRRIGKEMPLLSESVRAHGVRTGGFTAGAFTSAHFGLDRGFDHFGGLWRGSAEAMVDKVLEWVQSVAQTDPLFVFLHLMDVHEAWRGFPPFPRLGVATLEEMVAFLNLGRADLDTEERSILRGLYARQVEAVDAALGRLQRGIAECRGAGETAWLLTSDHGEGIEGAFRMFHMNQLWESEIRVPWIQSVPWLAGQPGVPAPGARIGAMVNHLDLLPTVLATWGAAPPKHAAGRLLPPWVEVGALPPDVPTVSHCMRPFMELTAYRTARAKYIRRRRLAWSKIRELIAARSAGNRVEELSMERDQADASAQGRDPVTAHTAFRGGLHRLKDRRWLVNYLRHARFEWFRYPAEQVFDLVADPEERANLARKNPDLRDELRQGLAVWLARHLSDVPVGGGESAADVVHVEAELRERLRALGYME